MSAKVSRGGYELQDINLQVRGGHIHALLDEVDLAGLADPLTTDLPQGRKRALELATTLCMAP